MLVPLVLWVIQTWQACIPYRLLISITDAPTADLIVSQGETVQLILCVTDTGAVADVDWAGNAPSCPGCFENIFIPTGNGEVIVTVTDTSGCEAVASVLLTVRRNRNVFIPSVFSPNHDGINDVFRIEGNTLSMIGYMRIFDRWGAVIYEQNPEPAGSTAGWDGTFQGQAVHPGVYVYTALLIHDDGKEEVVSGDVTLVR